MGGLVLLLGDDGLDAAAAQVGAVAAAASSAIASLLSKATGEHLWKGWTFSPGWGSRDTLDVTLVQPDVVGEVGVDVARDSAGRWRHPVRWH